MKVGCCVWPVRWSTPYEEAIKRIAKLGFKGIELIAWDRKTLDEHYTKKKIKELKELIGSSGLELTEFVSTPREMASLKKQDQEAALSHFKRLIEVASQFETGIVNTVSPWPFHGIEAPNIKERSLNQIRMLPSKMPRFGSIIFLKKKNQNYFLSFSGSGKTSIIFA